MKISKWLLAVLASLALTGATAAVAQAPTLTLVPSANPVVASQPVLFTATATTITPVLVGDALVIEVLLPPEFRYRGTNSVFNGANCVFSVTNPVSQTNVRTTCTFPGPFPAGSRTIVIDSTAGNVTQTPTITAKAYTQNNPSAKDTVELPMSVNALAAHLPALDRTAIILLGLFLALVGMVAMRRQG